MTYAPRLLSQMRTGLFAWFESCRTVSKDFEYQTDTSQAMIRCAMIKLMCSRIKK